MKKLWRVGASKLTQLPEADSRRRAGAFEGADLTPGGPIGALRRLDLDIEHLSRQTFGDLALQEELLSLFDEQAAQFLARLSAPFSEGSPALSADEAHGLKGSALAIGAAATAKAADDYETALRDDPATVEACRALLARAIHSARRAVAARRQALRK